MKLFFWAAALLAVNGLLPLSDNAASAAPYGRSISAPKAFYAFCTKHPDQCQIRGKIVQVMPMDDERWDQLRSVNRHINRTVRERTDKARWGKLDVWSIVSPGQSGDCEDFALTKRKELIAMGWPSSTLLVSVVRTRRGEGHAVLAARTSEGDFILDSRTSSIRRAARSGYRFFTMQSPNNPRKWITIPRKGPAATRTTAKVKTAKPVKRVAAITR